MPCIPIAWARSCTRYGTLQTRTPPMRRRAPHGSPSGCVLCCAGWFEATTPRTTDRPWGTWSAPRLLASGAQGHVVVHGGARVVLDVGRWLWAIHHSAFDHHGQNRGLFPGSLFDLCIDRCALLGVVDRGGLGEQVVGARIVQFRDVGVARLLDGVAVQDLAHE